MNGFFILFFKSNILYILHSGNNLDSKWSARVAFVCIYIQTNATRNLMSRLLPQPRIVLHTWVSWRSENYFHPRVIGVPMGSQYALYALWISHLSFLHSNLSEETLNLVRHLFIRYKTKFSKNSMSHLTLFFGILLIIWTLVIIMYDQRWARRMRGGAHDPQWRGNYINITILWLLIATYIRWLCHAKCYTKLNINITVRFFIRDTDTSWIFAEVCFIWRRCFEGQNKSLS